MSHLIAVSSPLQQKHLKRVSEWQSGRVAGTVLYMLYMNIWQHGKFAFMWQKRIISFFKIIPDFILVQQCYLQWRIVWFMRPWIHGEYLQKKNPTDYCVAPTIRKSFDLTIIIEKSSKPAVNFEVIEPDSKIDDWERVNFKNHWSQWRCFSKAFWNQTQIWLFLWNSCKWVGGG